MLLQDLAGLLTADEINRMLADGLGDLTRRADELLRVSTKPQPPTPSVQDEVLVLEASNDLTSATAAAKELRALAGRLEGEGQDVSRVAIRVTAWKRRQD